MQRVLYNFNFGKFKCLEIKKGSPCFLVSDSRIYNLAELKKKYKIKASNNNGFLSKFLNLKRNILEAVDELDGIYSLAYFDGNSIFLARDILGLNPLWYSTGKGLAFSFVKNDLEKIRNEVKELDPRKILKYEVETGKSYFIDRPFFSSEPEITEQEEAIVKNLSCLFFDSVRKRASKKSFAVSFSGGIDSTLIAFMCKKLGHDFTCYTSYFSHPNIGDSQDLVYAKKVAKFFGFKLKCVKLDISQTEHLVKSLVPFLGPDPVKIGVAITFFAACEQARKDGSNLVFSGLGSEELFAGYHRHKLSFDVNKECVSGLLKMYERDTYRDYIVGMLNNVDVETPFLDKFLVGYSLKIPSNFKLKGGVEKFILRKVAISLGIPEEFAFRKKKAAQYGSNFDKALGKLTKKNGFKLKADYLKAL